MRADDSKSSKTQEDESLSDIDRYFPLAASFLEATTGHESNGPPPYDSSRTQPNPSLSPAAQPSSGVGDTDNLPSNVPASNFVMVKHQQPICATYVIDSSLEVPDDLLKTEDNGGNVDRKNLLLESTSALGIWTDIWLVNESLKRGQTETTGRAVIDVHCKSWIGGVNVKLYSTTAHPFALSASSNRGNINIALPREFVGPLTMSGVRSVNSVIFSDAMKSRLMSFSEVEDKRTYFVGNFRTTNYTNMKDWTGSTVDIRSVHGSDVKLWYADENEPQYGCVVM